MIYVLGEPEDVDVLWLAVSLRARGCEVDVVLPQELMVGSSFTCRIDPVTARGKVRLADGRVIEPSSTALVVNRILDVPATAGEQAPADAHFVTEEWRAALAAWLRTMTCPVLNPPRAASLGGPQLPVAAWRDVAHAFGLATRRWQSDDPDEGSGEPSESAVLTCVGPQCLDPSGFSTAPMRDALAALATHVGAPLLAATFERTSPTPELTGVHVRPALRTVGDPLLDALVGLAARHGGGLR